LGERSTGGRLRAASQAQVGTGRFRNTAWGRAVEGRRLNGRAFNFNFTEVLIQGAYEATGAFLRNVHVDGPGLYGSPSGQ